MTESFKALKTDVGLKNEELLSYIKAKVIREFEDSNLMVGLDKLETP